MFLYNSKGMIAYDGKIPDGTPKINFYQILKNHFGEFKENEGHVNIIRDSFKIYFHWNGILENYIKVDYSGIKAVEELLKLSKLQNWSAMTPGGNVLVNLEFIDKERLEEFLTD